MMWSCVCFCPQITIAEEDVVHLNKDMLEYVSERWSLTGCLVCVLNLPTQALGRPSSAHGQGLVQVLLTPPHHIFKRIC